MLFFLFFLAARTVTAETWCARSIDRSTNSGLTFTYLKEDPLGCRANPEPYDMGYDVHQGMCQEIELVDDIPVGWKDSDATLCGQIPWSQDPLNEATEGTSWRDFYCYYNVFSNEFCANAFNTSVPMECFSLDEREENMWPTVDGSRRWRTSLNRGSCQDDFPVTVLPELERTDEFLNARNEYLNEERSCPFENLATASVNDYRQVELESKYCLINPSGGACLSTDVYTLQGQEVLAETQSWIAQRQGEEVCISYRNYNKDCVLHCMNIEEYIASGAKVVAQTRFISAGPGVYDGSKYEFRLLSQSDGSTPPSDSNDSSDSTRGCYFNTEQACREAALELGLQLGGSGYPFSSTGTAYQSGCYFYDLDSDEYTGTAYFGNYGTTEDKESDLGEESSERLSCQTVLADGTTFPEGFFGDNDDSGFSPVFVVAGLLVVGILAVLAYRYSRSKQPKGGAAVAHSKPVANNKPVTMHKNQPVTSPTVHNTIATLPMAHFLPPTAPAPMRTHPKAYSMPPRDQEISSGEPQTQMFDV